MQSYNFLNAKLVSAQRTATDLLKAYFTSARTSDPKIGIPENAFSGLISTPTYSVTSESVVVQLFYYASNAVTSQSAYNTKLQPNGAPLNALVAALSRLFTKFVDIPVQLRIVRLNQPYLNSSILAQYLAINASKYGFARLRQYVLSVVLSNNQGSTKDTDPLSRGSAILGVKVQVSGLLTTQRMAPRKTVSTVTAGTFHGPNTHIDYSTHTSKSALGSYTVKV